MSDAARPVTEDVDALIEQARIYVARDPNRKVCCFPRATLAALASALESSVAREKEAEEALGNARALLSSIAADLETVECDEWPFDPTEEPEAARALMAAAERVHRVACEGLTTDELAQKWIEASLRHEREAALAEEASRG